MVVLDIAGADFIKTGSPARLAETAGFWLTLFVAGAVPSAISYWLGRMGRTEPLVWPIVTGAFISAVVAGLVLVGVLAPR